MHDPELAGNLEQPLGEISSGMINAFHDRIFDGPIDWQPSYEVRGDLMLIKDPVWGDETIGTKPEDEVLIRLAMHNGLRRLQAVEQLTLPGPHTTIPNTSAFSRWEHIWGSVVLVRRLARQHDLPEDASIRFQLRTLLSDVGHTTGSHRGDWIFQGNGGLEDLHDEELSNYLEAIGVHDILQKCGFDPNEVIFPEVEDWVECPSPDLCIDRVDYGMREIRRWVPGPLGLRYIYRQDKQNDNPDFQLVGKNLAMIDQQKAADFGRAFLELSREHWSEPVHRLQLYLDIIRSKRVFTGGHGYSLDWLNYHPRDVMYCNDPDYIQAMREHDPFGHMVDAMMSDIARYERSIGWWARKTRIESRLAGLGGTSGVYHDYPTHHPMLSIETSDTTADEQPGTLAFYLPPLKVRQINPQIITRSGLQPLSEINESFASDLLEHRSQMGYGYTARLAIADASIRNFIKNEIATTEDEWLKLLERPRMSPEEMSRHVGEAAISSAVYGFTKYQTD